MKYITSILVIFFNLSILQSQPCSDPLFSDLNWLSYFGGNGDDEIIDVDVDTLSGHIYILESTSNSNFLSNVTTIGTSPSTKNAFVACLDEASNVLWATSILGWDMPYSIHLNHDLSLIGVQHWNRFQMVLGILQH